MLPLARHVEHVPGLLHALPDPGEVLVRVVERGLGFGRIVDSEIEAPNVFVDPVSSGWAVVQSGDTAEP